MWSRVGVLYKSSPGAGTARGQRAAENTEEEVVTLASEVRKTFLEETALGQLLGGMLDGWKGSYRSSVTKETT